VLSPRVYLIYQCVSSVRKLSYHLTGSLRDLITKNSEPKTQVSLLRFVNKIKNFWKRHIGKNILSFCQCRIENECFSRRGNCRSHRGRKQKYIARLLEEFQARFDHFPE